MTIFKFKPFTTIVLLVLLSACTKKTSIYQELDPDQDGIVAIEIPDDGQGAMKPEPQPRDIDQLAPHEKDLVDQWHEGEVDKLSFVVVDVENQKVIKSYFAETAQRLASVSKISTALAALENVNNVEVPKVQNMLKTSNNGEASRYVRLSAKALEGYEAPGRPYSEAHSCPDAFLQEEEAANIVLEWVKSQLPQVNWIDASLNDGAGCHYDNFMTPLQVSKILQFADSQGAVYDGQDFEDLLSINGVDGTWKNKNLEHKGYIFAKTGTLNPNANLSGYFYARRNGRFVKHYFSVFVQKKGGGTYSINARKLIEGLMRYWIDYYSSQPGDPLYEF